MAKTASVVQMVSVLASSVVNCGFEPWDSGKTKQYKIGIYYFYALARRIKK